MAVRRRVINEKQTWVIDRRFRNGSTTERYRRAAQVQTRQGAEAEERRLQNYFAEHGTIAPFLNPPSPTTKTEELKVFFWEDATAYYLSNVVGIHEPSTQKGYRNLIRGPHLSQWVGTPLTEFSWASMTAWDARLAASGISASTRRNQHIMLRCVIKCVGPLHGEPGIMLDKLPVFPRLPKVGRSNVQVVSSENIAQLLGPRPKGFRFKTWALFLSALVEMRVIPCARADLAAA